MFQKMYTDLFNAVTDAVKLLQENDAEKALILLKKAQQSVEEMYIQDMESDV